LRPLHPEVHRTAPEDWHAILPNSIGGDHVKLLIGIRSSTLAPILQFTLPSGLGIYKSILPDINGSFICFGGPHAVFTRGYARSGPSANHLQVYLTQIANAYSRSPYTFPSSHPPKGSSAAPLECPMHERRVHSCDPSQPTSTSEEIVPDELMPPIFGAHKALIPLSKLRGLLDNDDIPEVRDSKCDTCANCPTCRLSARAKTKSLQEEFEQEIIEKSVTIDYSSKRVMVDLPLRSAPGGVPNKETRPSR
jgi:hypothetical protein